MKEVLNYTSEANCKRYLSTWDRLNLCDTPSNMGKSGREGGKGEEERGREGKRERGRGGGTEGGEGEIVMALNQKGNCQEQPLTPLWTLMPTGVSSIYGVLDN